jgi:cysteine desulfurase family protein (TIGR01976 family)
VTVTVDNELRQLLRSQFPALKGDTIFLENAGGSQVPAIVANRIRDYMLGSYVQLGAGYELSQQATAVVQAAHDFVRLLMGGQEGEVILGPSTSALLQMLADSYSRVLEPGQEIIVAQTGHEANVGPWIRLERQGLKILWWEMDADSYVCSLERLDELLSERTAIVALPHVSNLLGEIVDLGAITGLAHQAGAKVVADGVAYAPHRAMDVAGWGVDWYAYSTYKVYGPHMGAMWGSAAALAELTGPNHFFIEDVPHQFELGGVCHEGCAGLLGLADYLKVVAGMDSTQGLGRSGVEQAFELMTACEQPLVSELVGYLDSRSDVLIIGPNHDGSDRVGTISFVHASKSSREITEVVDRSGVAIRHGHMYAYRLCEAAGLDPDDGVVRISLVHSSGRFAVMTSMRIPWFELPSPGVQQGTKA